ncbi:hypothetical protein [Sulfurovum mangrovi]|uniref:hypothetical protein n=1 Tax=Sulfurovum mangrovi TaxID=2893889 RepID=UPI001E4993FF|nr:hypothetical protein [Sulfurovum mangrovi]UFH59042.1 hypothetical protein LN246_11930 [Sulfurovum mangrovi]
MCLNRRVVFAIGITVHFLVFINLFSMIKDIHIVYSIVITILFFTLPILLSIFTKCPKCSNFIFYNPHANFAQFNPSLPLSNKYCKKCGQDLDKCEIETDEITNKHLGKPN